MASSDSGMVNGRSARQGLRGKPTIRKFTHAVGVPVVSDVYGIIPVFKDETLIDMKVVCDDLDSNGTATIDLRVGDSLDGNRFSGAADVITAQTGGVWDWATDTVASDYAALDGSYTFTQDDTIDITVQTGPATGQAGNITVIATLI